MATRMLIDASHNEETRVVIVKGTRLEEFDFETADYLFRSPAAYVGQLGFSVYVDRDYAPLDVRMRADTQYIS